MGGFAEENSDVFSQRRKLWGAPVDIHPLRRVQYMQPYPAGDTAKGLGNDPPPPLENRLRTGESRAVTVMLCMSLWPGFLAAVKPRAHVLTATRKHGDAHN